MIELARNELARNELARILESVNQNSDDQSAWLSLAEWLRDNGNDDEASAVRVFWSAIADSIAMGMMIEQALKLVRKNARNLGRKARDIDEASVCNRN